MATFTATASDSSTIGYAYFGSSSWNTGTSSGACQGAYQQTSAKYSRVGVLVFSGAGAVLQKKIITQITLKIVSSSAGSSSDSKVLTLCKSNYQGIPSVIGASGVNGSDQVGAVLGTLTDKFYGNTTTHMLSESSNAALFTALKAYLAEGNSAVVLYNGEIASSTSTYSSNYARVTSCTITVTYEDAVVWCNKGGEWLACAVWYCKDGQWIRCVPYYNRDGTWIQV